MEALVKILLAPFIALGVILVALPIVMMLSAGYGLDSIFVPTAIIVTGFAAIYWRRRRNRAPVGAGGRKTNADLVEQAPEVKGDQVYTGHGATVVLHDRAISIFRHGGASFVLQGLKGEKRIPFRSISAVQFKTAGRHMSGYIQFSIVGSIESRAGILDATLDENTVMFTPEQNDRFEMLRDLIEARSHQAHATASHIVPSMADEIGKFAELRDKGILTDAEFANQKQRLLGG